MAYTKNPTFVDLPLTSTPVTAAMYNKYEQTLFEVSAGLGLPASRYLVGSGDETAAFQAWIAAAKASGEIMVGNANMTIHVSSTLDMRAHQLRYIGNGMQIIQTGTNRVGVMVGGFNQVISGLHHAFSAQAGTSDTASAGIEFYEGFQCFYHDISSDLAYDSLRLAQSGWAPVSTTTNTVFSCIFSNIFIDGYTHRALSMQTWPTGGGSSTGCLWHNIYIHNNYTGTPMAATDGALVFTDWDESVFAQINIEWGIFPTGQDAWFMQRFKNCTAESIHFEGITLTGNAGLFRVYESTNLKVTGLNFVNSTLLNDGGTKSILHAGHGGSLSCAHSLDGVRIAVSGQAALLTSGGQFVLASLDSDMATNGARVTFDRVDVSSLTSATSTGWVFGDNANSPCVQQLNDEFRGPRSADVERVASGITTMPRGDLTSAVAGTMTSQLLRLAYFTAPATTVCTQFRLLSGSTAAGATPTLVQAALFTVAANGDLTQVVRGANTTSLLAAANTIYASAFNTPGAYTLVCGFRYALGLLVVTAATAPVIAGQLGPVASEFGLNPVMSGQVAGQSTMPTSITAGSVTASASRMYAAVLP